MMLEHKQTGLLIACMLLSGCASTVPISIRNETGVGVSIHNRGDDGRQYKWDIPAGSEQHHDFLTRDDWRIMPGRPLVVRVADIAISNTNQDGVVQCLHFLMHGPGPYDLTLTSDNGKISARSTSSWLMWLDPKDETNQ